MKITFHGQACFLVESEGHRVIIDPYLSGNSKAVIRPEEVEVDAVLLTHGHLDHILDAEAIARRNDALIVAVHEIADYYESKGLRAHGMHLGGSREFGFGRLKLTLAFHGSGLETPEGTINGGNPAGLLLTMGGKTFYHAGDTALFGDMKLIGELNRIDAAALPIGDNYTMGPEDALYAAEWLRAGMVIPMHYNTFDVIRQDPHAYVAGLERKGLRGTVLEYGQSLHI